MGVIPYALFTDLSNDLLPYLSRAEFSSILEDKVPDWPGMTFQQRAASSIIRSLLKKYEGGMSDETKKRALDKFLAVDKDCAEWVLPTDGLPYDDLLLGEFRDQINNFWNRYDPRYEFAVPLIDSNLDVLPHGSISGPGVSIGSPGNDLYSKLFSSGLSVTSRSLYTWYKRYIWSIPEWSNAESIRFLDLGDPQVVTGNRLSFVPKDDSISRSICVEPTLNMFYQLGFGTILTKRLKEFTGIDLSDQQFRNRELARIGSLDESFATIDLSSASDSISIRMLEWALPADFLRWLKAYRSPFTRLPDGRLHATNMISTMGNGYTFPLQTVIFACAVLSAMKCDGLAPSRPNGVYPGNFGVNGDDIVVPSRVCGKVLRLLHLLGFKINKDKTFVEGPFRESCGGDFLHGRNIRGVYIKRLRFTQDYFSAINQLNQFSTRTGILLPQLVQRLLKKVPFWPTPRWENDDAGIRMPYSIAYRYVGRSQDEQSILYSALKPTPPPKIRIMDSALVIPRSFKLRIWNPSGLHICFLQGSVNSHTISLLPKSVKYRRKRQVAASWDHPNPPRDLSGLLVAQPEAIQLLKGWFDWGRWETVTYLNLFS